MVRREANGRRKGRRIKGTWNLFPGTFFLRAG
jgi:hypothetical protein